jgi:cytochrome c peroxidase
MFRIPVFFVTGQCRWPKSRLAVAPVAVIVAALAWFGPGWSSLHADMGDSAGHLNPHPVSLHRRRPEPLSAMAQLGRQLFFDPTLSASGRQSCASCHDPAHAFGPPNALPVQLGGPDMDRQGLRPPPSLEYLEREPNFSIGPDNEETENVNLQQLAKAAAGSKRARKRADVVPATPAMVPQGGMFWDGRADTLQSQVYGPLLNPVEMANANPEAVARKLDRPSYHKALEQLFGPAVFKDTKLLVAEATFALARYQFEEPAFHPYDSKFDAWLEGRARFNDQEMLGYELFNDPKKGNCAACHIDKPTLDGLPPLFTDHQYEALAVPRNSELAVNRDPKFFDLGICGPMRTDLAGQTQYCGMFRTPTLRNVARRKVFFHNGTYHSLKQVLEFYDFRASEPEKIYPRDHDGKLLRYDDLPAQYWNNIDTMDAPFNQKPGDAPPLSDADMRDIIAFLQTLNDGGKR